MDERIRIDGGKPSDYLAQAKLKAVNTLRRWLDTGLELAQERTWACQHCPAAGLVGDGSAPRSHIAITDHWIEYSPAPYPYFRKVNGSLTHENIYWNPVANKGYGEWERIPRQRREYHRGQ